MVARPMPRLLSIRSTRTRLKISPQVSSSATRMPAASRGTGEKRAARDAAALQRSEKIDSREARESLGDGQSFGIGKGVGGAAAKSELPPPGCPGRGAQKRSAIADQHIISFLRAIPFEQGEFGMMQRSALAVAKYFGEFDDAPFAGGQKFLAGEFGRGTQIMGRRGAVRRGHLGGEGADMCFVAGRDLENRGFDLAESCAANQARRRPRSARASAE